MSERRLDARRVAIIQLLGGFALLALISFAFFAFASLLDGVGMEVVTDPLDWLARLDHENASSILFGASQVVAGLLSIAITVSAIVVELAATKYNHRITQLFLSEPINIAVISLFVVTTIECIWIAASRAPPEVPGLPNAAFAVTMALVTVCLVLLLPYFAFVFAFLSPLSIIDKIRGSAHRAIEQVIRGKARAAKHSVLEIVDELQDVARSASEQSDRSIAMKCVEALEELLVDYQSMRARLPDAWFDVDATVAKDPDFVSLAPSVQQRVRDERLWLEVKILKQYLALMLHCVPERREVANLIAINTARIAIDHGGSNRALLEHCIRCFNSYLRFTINAADPRTGYYVMNQYRMLAESLMADGFDEPVREIAGHLKSYGQMAYERGTPFLLTMAAKDLTTLVEASLATRPGLTDDLLSVVLEVDQEIRSETQEVSLLGVRKAQLQLATLFALRGEEVRAKRICRDLAGEPMARLERLRRELESETRSQYWEVDDRGVNFGYLPEDRRAQLGRLMAWIAECPPSSE